MAIKGFAFVEFSDETGAKAAVAKAVETEAKIDPNTKDPSALQTVVAYNKEQAIEKGLENIDIKEEESGDTKMDTEEPKQPKKKNRKKTKMEVVAAADPNAAGQPTPQEVVIQSLRIMSKADWRKLRNKYLNLQKKNMSAAKGKIKQMEAMQERRKASPEPQPAAAVAGAAAATKEVEFVPGVIVKFALSEPVIENGKMFKARIRAAVMEPVKYVDALNGQMQVV